MRNRVGQVGQSGGAMRINSDGQVTIPQHIRDAAGLMPGTDVVFDVVEGGVRLRKADTSPSLPTRGQTLVASLRGTGRYPMPTDAIITLMRGPSTDEEAEASAVPTA